MVALRRDITGIYSALDIAYPGAHGGSEHVGGAVISLKKYCKHVYLLSKRERGQPFLETQDHLTIIRFPFLHIPVVKVILYFLYAWLATQFLLLIKDITFIYERGRIFGGGAVIAGLISGKTTYYELNEPVLQVPLLRGELQKNSLRFTLVEKLHRFILRHASVVVATHISSLEHLPHKRSLLLQYGADTQMFRPMQDVKHLRQKYHLTPGKTLLYIGSFSRWHAWEAMINALSYLVKKDKRIKFLIVGHGETYDTVVQLVRAKGLETHVIFVGKVPNHEVVHYITVADVCLALFDRRYPPFKALGYYYSPLKVHDYKACAKPVVASDYPQLRILIKEGVNGYLVDETKATSIARAIERLLANPKLAQKIGKKNREEVLQIYTWDHFNEQVLKTLPRQ